MRRLLKPACRLTVLACAPIGTQAQLGAPGDLTAHGAAGIELLRASRQCPAG